MNKIIPENCKSRSETEREGGRNGVDGSRDREKERGMGCGKGWDEEKREKPAKKIRRVERESCLLVEIRILIIVNS